jgi:hypothetical protein
LTGIDDDIVLVGAHAGLAALGEHADDGAREFADADLLAGGIGRTEELRADRLAEHAARPAALLGGVEGAP